MRSQNENNGNAIKKSPQQRPKTWQGNFKLHTGALKNRQSLKSLPIQPNSSYNIDNSQPIDATYLLR